jgi:hypothetical protein
MGILHVWTFQHPLVLLLGHPCLSLLWLANCWEQQLQQKKVLKGGWQVQQIVPVEPSLLQAAPGPSPLAAALVQWLGQIPSLASKTQLGTMKPTRTVPSPSQGLAQ